MLDAEHIHRLVVVDVHDQIIGVVSTMDIVAALLGIADEMTALRRHHAHSLEGGRHEPQL
jgi:CBS-domain-containing membrane protein